MVHDFTMFSVLRVQIKIYYYEVWHSSLNYLTTMLLPGVLSNANGQQTLVAQPKSPSASLAQGAQVIGSPTQIRFSTQPTFVTTQGQILSQVSPAMLSQLQVKPQGTVSRNS